MQWFSTGLIYPYFTGYLCVIWFSLSPCTKINPISFTSGLLHWYWGNHMIAPVPVKQPWKIGINVSHFGNYIIIFIMSIFRLGCCSCPIQCGWQHQATLNTGSPSVSCHNITKWHIVWLYSGLSRRHWKLRVFMMLTFSSLEVLYIIITTTTIASSDEMVVIITTLNFQWMSVPNQAASLASEPAVDVTSELMHVVSRVSCLCYHIQLWTDCQYWCYVLGEHEGTLMGKKLGLCKGPWVMS